MIVGVLALRGAFIEHEQMLRKLGADTVELREKEDLQHKPDALILPGGESTAKGKLLKDLDMFDTVKQWIIDGMPVMGTCAGMILLAEKLVNDDKQWLQTFPVSVRRNAYGRQLGSFITRAPFKGIGEVTMNFIRAPYIESISPGVEVLAEVNNHIVAARYGKQMILSFHPEIGEDTRIHQQFIQMVHEKN